MVAGLFDEISHFQSAGLVFEILPQQIAEPDDGVHGRAQFMAEQGDEIVFDHLGSHQLRARLQQIGLLFFARAKRAQIQALVNQGQ